MNEMLELPRLNSVAKCPKCTQETYTTSTTIMGHPIHDSFTTGPTEHVRGKALALDGSLIDLNSIDEQFSTEFMLRTCTCCGYKWKEACADA